MYKSQNKTVNESRKTRKIHCHCLYLEPWRWVESLYDLGVVEEAVGSVADGHHSAAAAIDVDAVHVAEGQADVGGRLRQDGEALIGRVGALRQAQHGYRGQLVNGVQWSLCVVENLGGGNERRGKINKLMKLKKDRGPVVKEFH